MTAQATPSIQNYTIGKGMTYFIPALTALPTQWSADLAVTTNMVLYTPAGDVFTVKTAGTTGSTAPVAGAGDITDGTATLDSVAWNTLGNCPKLEFTADYDTIDHYSSMAGIKTRDLRVITNIRGGINITLDEITPKNLAMGLIGTTPTGSVGSETFNLLAGATNNGILKFVGTNEVGPKYAYLWPNVAFTPSKTTGVITDEFVTLEMEAFVNKDASGVFGVVKQIS
jgi:hypothetical protein